MAAGSASPAAPVPFVPILPAPLPATGPLGRSLNGAYQAIVGAGVRDPAAAQRAAFLYAQARERASRGDVSGALAAASAAQAAALQSGPQAGVAPAISTIPQLPAGRLTAPSPYAPTGDVPRTATVPLADTANVLPADVLVARNEIELAERLHPGASLDAAKKDYRSALDAYLSGNAALEHRAARASFESAADVLSRGK